MVRGTPIISTPLATHAGFVVPALMQGELDWSLKLKEVTETKAGSEAMLFVPASEFVGNTQQFVKEFTPLRLMLVDIL
jgi:hypothetical protein